MSATILALLYALQSSGPPPVHPEPEPMQPGVVVTDTIGRSVTWGPATGSPADLPVSDVADLVARARSRRSSSDHSILSYRALARQRVTVGYSALRRERLLYRRESAARLHWRRYGAPEVELLGAREVVPPLSGEVGVPGELDRSEQYLIFDPGEDRILPGSIQGDSRRGLHHPLADDGGEHYDYELGGSTTITLPDGRVIRLLELRVRPRRSDPRLVSGSLWIETDTYAVVQGVYKLARPFDLERDLGDSESAAGIRRVPGMLKPIRAELQYLTVDYGFWDMEWWLPRVIALEGQIRAGRVLRVPVRYELAYSEYEVFADPSPYPLPNLPTYLAFPGDTIQSRGNCRRGTAGCRCQGGLCRLVRVVVPSDSAQLLSDPHLPASIFSAGPELISEAEVESARRELRKATAPLELVGPTVRWGLDRPGLIRFNRVEGLSTALRIGAEYGNLGIGLTPRIAWSAPRRSGARIDLHWEGDRYETDLGLYREIAAVDPDLYPFHLSNSLNALIRGRDQGDYYGVDGLGFGVSTVPGTPIGWGWRLYAERHYPVRNGTTTSLRRLWSGTDPFRPNIVAEEASLIGLSLETGVARGLDPLGLRWGISARAEGATGSHDFGRYAIGAQVATPLLGGVDGSVELVGGGSFGRVPVQRLWSLGGSTTLRGYPPRAVTGTAFWRVRGEAGPRFRGARLVALSDLGWAGSTRGFPGGRVLAAGGVGLSLYDGLLRVDLARPLRGRRGWRLSVGSGLAL